MNLPAFHGAAMLIPAGLVILLLWVLGKMAWGGAGSTGSSGKKRRRQKEKRCPRCGAKAKPMHGDYYRCTKCKFVFTATGRWTNGHMPRLLLEPLRVYGLLVMAAMALAASLLVIL